MKSIGEKETPMFFFGESIDVVSDYSDPDWNGFFTVTSRGKKHFVKGIEGFAPYKPAYETNFIGSKLKS